MDDYVKKPECSVRKKGRSLEGGPKEKAHLKREGMNSQKGFFFRRSPVREHGVLHSGCVL